MRAGLEGRGPGGQGARGPEDQAGAPRTRRHEKVIDITPLAVALHAFFQVRCVIDQVGLAELFKAVDYGDGSDERFLRRLWRDLDGDEPTAGA